MCYRRFFGSSQYTLRHLNFKNACGNLASRLHRILVCNWSIRLLESPPTMGGQKMLMMGERLRKIRESKNLSQGDIEQRTGMLRCYTSRVENGHTVPSIETLTKYAQALDIPLLSNFLRWRRRTKENQRTKPRRGEAVPRRAARDRESRPEIHEAESAGQRACAAVGREARTGHLVRGH